MIIEAESNMKIAEADAETESLSLINRRATEEASKRIEIDEWASVSLFRAEASLEAARSSYAAKL